MGTGSAIAIGSLPAAFILAGFVAGLLRHRRLTYVLMVAGLVLYAAISIGLAVMGGRGML